MSRSLGLTLVAVATTLAASSCAGGHASNPLPAASAAASGNGVGTATVRVVVNWPAASTPAMALGRRAIPTGHARDYVSASTESLTIAVDGGTPIDIDNPAFTGNPQSSTTTDFNAPIGSDMFTAIAYDKTGGTGNELSANTIPYTIVKDVVNTVPIVLDGNLSKIVCTAVAPFVSGSGTAFSLTGVAGQLLLTAEDPDNNAIVGPGTPTVTFTPMTASQGTVSATSTTNEYTVSPTAENTAVPFVASGTSIAGATVSSTCDVTRVPAMWVTNNGIEAQNESVTIYPASASGDATPLATLAGAKAELANVQFDAVDGKGDLFVSNTGPLPGATYGPAAGYVAVYGPGTQQVGNSAPIALITGINRPEGLAFDSSGNLFVTALDRVLEYPPSANGVTAPAVASATIAGSNANIATCYGAAVANGNIYITCTPYPFYIQYWPLGTTGNVAPTGVINGAGNLVVNGAQTTYNEVSWLSIAADSSGNLYAPDANNNQNSIFSYAGNASGNATPAFIATGTGFSQPVGIAADSGNAFYVANYGFATATGGSGAPSVETFSSATVLQTGVATSTLAGAATGLNGPYGVVVK